MGVKGPHAVSPRFPVQRSSEQGESAPKARQRCVADGQQVEIPVLRYDRTVGTRKESGSREWKARCKRGTSHFGKSGWQWEAVMRSEIQVAKSVSHASRKAAIVYTVPVP